MNHNQSDSGKASSPAKKSWAVCNFKAVLFFAIVTAIAAGSDLWSKSYVFDRLLSDKKVAPRIEAIKLSAKFRPQLNDLIQKAQTDPNHTRMLMGSLQQGDDPILKEKFLPGMNLTLSTNPGVVFGIKWLPRWAVNIITILMIFAVIGYFAFSNSKMRGLHFALGLILGGAIGNLYDRLFSSVAIPGLKVASINGHVRDFLDCSEIGYHWIFNIADAWLVLGVGLIMIMSILAERRAKKQKASQADQEKTSPENEASA